MNKYFLVYRDKLKNNVKIDEFDTLAECIAVEDRDLKTWEGEIVRCWGRSKEELQQVYGEYRLPSVTFSSIEGVETITGQQAIDFIDRLENTDTPLPDHMIKALELVRKHRSKKHNKE